jgi:hypothetical protein
MPALESVVSVAICSLLLYIHLEIFLALALVSDFSLET